MAPLPRILVAFIIGILLACCTPKVFGQQYALIVSFASLLLTYMALVFLDRRDRKTHHAFGIAALAFAMVLGFVRTGLSHHEMHRDYGKPPRTMVATVVDYAVEKEENYATLIDCGKYGGRQLAYLWSSNDRPMRLEPGDVIHLKSSKRKVVADEIREMEHKGNQERRFLGYQKHLYYSHIYATLYASKWWKDKKQDGQKRLTWGKLRKKVAQQYRSLHLPTEEEAILTAMTLGDRRALKQRGMHISTRYSRAGVSHVLALSGFHLTIIYALLDILFLSSFYRRKYKWIPHLMVILCIWAYTLLAGTPPSLVRAALMCSLICLAKGIYGGKQSGLDALVLSAFIMLIFDPFYIMNISFQLSYASMLAITVCSPSLSRMQTSINKTNLPRIAKKAISYILGIILISAIATLATAGIVAYHFSSISLVGLATNICISILASVLMTAAVVWWGIRIIGAVTTLAQTPIVQTIEGWVGDCIKWLLKSMNQTVDYFASFSQATLNWNASLIEAILYYMILATLAFWLYNHSAFPLKYPK